MSDKIYIIAEAGVNHNGSLDMALQLVAAAKAAGVDCVKFQTFKAEKLVTATAEKAEYQKTNTGNNDSQFAMLKKLELSVEDHHKLLKRCQELEIEFLSTGFDIESLDFLAELPIQRFKIPSGELTNGPYLKQLAKKNFPTIMSTGMATMAEVEVAIELLLQNGLEENNLTILHCSSEYPAAFAGVNLRAMQAMQKKFNLPVGYSDHTVGIEIATAAVAMGATVIEKHFTLDKSLAGPDHQASLDPHELQAMVAAIRNVEQALGDGEKSPTKAELATAKVARKSIIAAKNIKKGEKLSGDNLTVKRPGTGISPMLWDQVIGTVAEKDYQVDEIL